MEFKILVKDSRSEWWEPYNKPEVVDLESAEEAGRGIVEYFNGSLRPGERPRTFIRAEMSNNGDAREPHEWEKTNLYTIMERGRSFDTARCKKCGVTAKRFGVGEPRLDSAFKAQVFRHCDTARTLLAKRAAKPKDTL